jgi:hypothetical protein
MGQFVLARQGRTQWSRALQHNDLYQYLTDHIASPPLIHEVKTAPATRTIKRADRHP